MFTQHKIPVYITKQRLSESWIVSELGKPVHTTGYSHLFILNIYYLNLDSV